MTERLLPRNARLRDVPQLSSDASNLSVVAEAIREAMQTLRGQRGDPLDRALTPRDLDLATQRIVSAGGAVTPGSSPSDPTSPPSAAGLVVTAGLGHIFIECDQPVYTQGRGHNVTIVYGSKWAFNDPTPPTFSEAVELFRFTGRFSAYPSDLNVRWCIWIKWQSLDGYLSNDPAGGTNGVQATTGKIGNADLNDLIVSAEKLSAGTYDGINLVPNPGAEDGTAAWALVEGTAQTFAATNADKTGGTNSFRITKGAAGDASAYGCLAFPVIPGETYSVKVATRANTAGGAGLYIRANEKASAPAGGYVTLALRDSITDFVGNGAMTTGWTRHEFTYVVPANRYWVSFSIYNWLASSATQLYWDDCAVGRQITASHIAAGSIAVGSAAIANGAIVNAMIANATIDTAKIANLDAAKINAGTLAAARIAAGSLDADKITAGTITVDRMRVTGRGAALNEDPQALDASAWTLQNASVLIGVNSAPGGGNTAIANTTGLFGVVYSGLVPCDSQTNYNITCQLNRTAGTLGIVYVGVVWYDYTGALKESNVAQPTGAGSPAGWSNGSFSYYGIAGTVGPSSWTEYQTSFGPTETRQIPSNAKYMRFGALLNQNADASTQYCLTDVRFTQKAHADLIVDGSITADKVAAGAITAAKVAAGAITADKIVVGTITAASGIIADAAIVTAKIADAQITTAKIGDANVSTLKIAGNAVTVPVTSTTTGLADTFFVDPTTNTFTLGSITTDANGSGKVLLWLGPTSETLLLAYYIGRINVSFSGTNTKTLRIRILRNTTVIHEMLYTTTAGSGQRTLLLKNNVVLDSPGAGVACTYYMELHSSGNQMFHEAPNIVTVLMEAKR